ncbi:MAG: alpha/beta fold hydrolase [Candidatus Acidiferrales bacterium]
MSGYAEVNGTRLYYEDAGTGRPVVFIGVGSGMDHRLWDDQFALFSHDFRAVRFDVRGVGQSAWPTEPFSPLDDLAALLDFLKIDNACLVGLSLGGALAIDFALAHPDRVACLVLVAPGLSGYQFSDGFQQRLAPFMAALQAGETERLVQLMLDDPYLLPAVKNPAARERAKKIWAENSRLPNVAPIGLDPPARNRLGEIHVPTLIVLGDSDWPDLYKIADLLESGIAGASRVTIPNSGHTVNMEMPDEFNFVALTFLQGLPK